MNLSAVASKRLLALLGERFTVQRGVCDQHAKGFSHHAPSRPDAVVFPNTAEEVAEIVKTCVADKTPMVPFGAGTSVEGQVHAVYGGVCIDLSRMNKIVAVNPEDLTAIVDPGVKRVQLNQHLRDTGLFFPIDPGADATIGGMASTRASGTNAVRYGTMKDNILALEVVTPSGDIVKTARRAPKSSAGYDLTRLMIGSEGTLGVITQITLKLSGIPEEIKAATCSFPSVADAVTCASETVQLGVPIARIELLDPQTIKAVNAVSKTTLPERPILFLEFHGTKIQVEEQVGIVKEIAENNDCLAFESSTTPEDRALLWRARHDAALSIGSFATGTEQWWTDVCVPISRLAECIVATQEDIKHSGIFAPILGHVGDGNFHVGICAEKGCAEQVEAAESLHDRLVRRALDMEGTCTGEHGIGLGKQEYLKMELGSAVDIMRKIKASIDPHNLMNPGKIFTN